MLALVRAAWLTAASFKLGLMLSLASLMLTAVPTFLATRALQGTMADAIRHEGVSFPGFIFVGFAGVLLMSLACTTVAEETDGAIRGGKLELMLGTRTPFAVIVAGLSGYQALFTGVRILVLLGTAAALGVPFVWSRVPLGLLMLALLALAHLPVGLLALASVLRFRNVSPLPQATIVVSSLLGGVYVPTTVLPGWIRPLADLVPMTYGLRASRRVLLEGAGLLDVWRDVAVLLAITAGLGSLALGAVALALRHARRTGSLAHT